MALVCVHTSPDVAYRFYSERRKIDFEAFIALRNAPVEQDVGKFLREADAVIYNWWGKQSYKQALKKFMSEVLHAGD